PSPPRAPRSSADRAFASPRPRTLDSPQFPVGRAMTSAEVARERAVVHGLYARLDALRDAVQRELESVRGVGGQGGTHQSRSERDAFARLYEDRLARRRESDARLAFGRLELQPVGGEEVHHYIGRIGLRDEDQRPILLDWRVPQASAFYQATAATPLGARARR